MDHDQKVAAALDELTRRGVWKMNSAPPLWRLLWRIGVKVPPPYFGAFWPTAALTGVFFGMVWGILMWFLLWRADNMPIPIAIVVSALAGVLFGITMAGYYRWRARQLGLPAWESYSGGGPAPPPR